MVLQSMRTTRRGQRPAAPQRAAPEDLAGSASVPAYVLLWSAFLTEYRLAHTHHMYACLRWQYTIVQVAAPPPLTTATTTTVPISHVQATEAFFTGGGVPTPPADRKEAPKPKPAQGMLEAFGNMLFPVLGRTSSLGGARRSFGAGGH